ncbi:Disease resistance protein RPM1 [Linum perenne]
MAGLPMDCLASKLDSVVKNEVSLFEQAGHHVEEIRRELASMRSFLEDSSNSDATYSKLKQTQIAHVRDLVYDVEDTVYKFIYHQTKWRSSSSSRKFLCFPLFFLERRKIATELGEINSLIKATPERYQRYQLEVNNQGSKGKVASNAESALFLKEEELIGIEASKKIITGWLTGGDSRLTTVSVVGMGGSGKTTLVANVFKSPPVKRCFDCCAWITVPQSFDIEHLLRRLIRELNKSAPMVGGVVSIDELSRMGYRDLVDNLMTYLEGKRYLLVLDDVRDANVWSGIKVSLPDAQNGSRIILTTRMEDIAIMYSSSNENGGVKPLDKKISWELFCRRAFLKNSKQCPPQLHDLAAEIVDKCQGLPLAIVSMGGLFSTKRCSIADWTRVRQNMQWELSNNQMLEPIKTILLLSYYDLPYRLKCCFLYCCMFPEDDKIWCGRLTRLWMAEGFVQVEVDGVTPEEVANGYLTELIHRNMLQSVDSELSVNDRMCKIHDMYREVGLTIAKQDKFFSVYNEESSVTRNQHRLSLHQASNDNVRDMIQLVEGMPRIRSLFVAGNSGCSTPFSLGALDCRRFRLLRVLDLEEAPVEELPHHMDNLFNLRLLNLFGTRVKRLPNSIGKLQNLQTLDIISTKVATLPKEIMKLHKLRHLATGYVKRTMLKEYNVMYGISVLSGSDISSLKNLQSLRLVEASRELINQLGLMTQLVVLGITNVRGKDQMDGLCRSIKNMPCLQQLSIAAGNEDDILQFDELGQSPTLVRLQYLSLYGKLDKFPNWVSSLPSLIDLQMHWSRLPMEEDPLQHLHRLQILSNLVLNNAYQGTELNFPIGFDNVKSMVLKHFPRLESISIAEGAMPDINMLQINSCKNLKTAAQGIQNLYELQELRLEDVSDELVERIRGPDRDSFSHIPLIRCHYYSSSRQQYVWENLL